MADDLDLVFDAPDYDRERLIRVFLQRGATFLTERTDERGETETLLQIHTGQTIWVPHWDKELTRKGVKYTWHDMASGTSGDVMRQDVARRAIANGEWAFLRMSWGMSPEKILALFTTLLDLADAMRPDGLAFRLQLDGEITREQLSAEAERQRQRASIGRALFGTVDQPDEIEKD